MCRLSQSTQERGPPAGPLQLLGSDGLPAEPRHIWWGCIHIPVRATSGVLGSPTWAIPLSEPLHSYQGQTHSWPCLERSSLESEGIRNPSTLLASHPTLLMLDPKPTVHPAPVWVLRGEGWRGVEPRASQAHPMGQTPTTSATSPMARTTHTASRNELPQLPRGVEHRGQQKWLEVPRSQSPLAPARRHAMRHTSPTRPTRPTYGVRASCPVLPCRR